MPTSTSTPVRANSRREVQNAASTSASAMNNDGGSRSSLFRRISHLGLGSSSGSGGSKRSSVVGASSSVKQVDMASVSLRDAQSSSQSSQVDYITSYSSSASTEKKVVWLDCDPGHDDAIALLLAIHHPAIHLAGVSTVAGNAPGKNTYVNAAKLLVALGAEGVANAEIDAGKMKGKEVEMLPVLLRGADEPLVKPPRKDSAIHGEDGLGGVVGLPSLDSPAVQRRLWASYGGQPSPSTSSHTLPAPSPSHVVSHLSTLLRKRRELNLPGIHLCITGPCTNIALFIKLHPELVTPAHIEQIVVMGGSAGAAGNRGPLAEFNVLVDPEAAAIVFDAPVKVVMAGLNVTHQAIFTPEVHDRLLRGSALPSASRAGSQKSPATSPLASPRLGDDSATAVSGSSPPLSPLRKLVSSALTFFASTYAQEFGFVFGPPVHDLLVIAYVVEPKLFWTAKEPTTSMGPVGLAAHLQMHLGSAKKHKRQSSRTEVDGHSTSPERHLPPKRYRVKVECSEHSLALGATVVDFHDQWRMQGASSPSAIASESSWGRDGRNVEVLEELDTEGLWSIFLETVDRAEDVLGQA